MTTRPTGGNRKKVPFIIFEIGGLRRLCDRDRWNEAVSTLGDLGVHEWDRLARASMSPNSARIYRAGITKVEPAPGMCAIVLAGTFPLMLERGWYEGVGVNLRTTMLRPGQKGVRVSKKGHRYRFISFRHQLPGKSGQTPSGYAGGVIGSADLKANIIRSRESNYTYRVVDAYADAKRTAAIITKAARGLRGGKALKYGLAPTLSSRHVSDIYGGMVRGPKGTGYRTFRTLSENPETMRRDGKGVENWYHPGIRARNLAPKVRAYIRIMIPVVVDGLRRSAA